MPPTRLREAINSEASYREHTDKFTACAADKPQLSAMLHEHQVRSDQELELAVSACLELDQSRLQLATAHQVHAFSVDTLCSPLQRRINVQPSTSFVFP